MAKYTFLDTDSVLALQWAERLLQGGETEQWGDKWEERFKEGKGTKKVSVPSCICSSCCYRQSSVDLLNSVAAVSLTEVCCSCETHATGRITAVAGTKYGPIQKVCTAWQCLS